MRIRDWEINCRLIDHQRNPRWLGPWIGIRHHVQTGFLFDAHAQWQRRPDEGMHGWQLGLAIAHHRRPHIRIGWNWWDRRNLQASKRYAIQHGWRIK